MCWHSEQRKRIDSAGSAYIKRELSVLVGFPSFCLRPAGSVVHSHCRTAEHQGVLFVAACTLHSHVHTYSIHIVFRYSARKCVCGCELCVLGNQGGTKQLHHATPELYPAALSPCLKPILS